MEFKVFKVSIFLYLTILFVITEDPPLQRIVRSHPQDTRNVNDKGDVPLQEYRDAKKMRMSKKK